MQNKKESKIQRKQLSQKPKTVKLTLWQRRYVTVDDVTYV